MIGLGSDKNVQMIDIWCIYAVNSREKCRKLCTFAVQNFWQISCLPWGIFSFHSALIVRGKRKKWQQCVLIWQNICLFWMIMKTWSGIEPCVLFWMQHWLVHWWHVKRRYSENYSLPSRERSTACTLLNCFQPHRNHPFHLKAWILWALNRRGQNEYRLEVVGLMWQMCETDSLRFIAFCCW